MIHNKKSARHKCAVILDQLNYDFSNFSIDDFVNSIESHLDRRIFFLALDIDSRNILGAWITDSSEPNEYIMTRKDFLPPAYHLHVQCHELGHLLLQHQTLTTSLNEIKNDPLSIPFRLLQNEQSRTQEQEIEAETMAYMILTKSSNPNLIGIHQPATIITDAEFFYSMGLD